MRIVALLLALLLHVPTFCLQLQQTSAATVDDRGVVNSEIADSDAFLQTATHHKPARDVSRRVESLLARMTLEEKVGQMTQLEIGMVTTGGDQTIQVDASKLDKAVVKYGVGSVLNVNG